mgnify:CR=1 FL=1
MTLRIIRAIFLLAIVSAACAMSLDYADIHYGSDQTPTDAPSGSTIPLVIVLGVFVLAVLTIVIDHSLPNKQISTISAIFFGLIVGLILTYLFQITGTAVFTEIGIHPSMQRWIYVIASVLLSYICITVLLQTQGQFRFVIPYVEFSKEIKEGTKKSHSAAENTAFVKSFLRGVISKESYRTLVSDLYFVYSALEH